MRRSSFLNFHGILVEIPWAATDELWKAVSVYSELRRRKEDQQVEEE
jgi:hypothetical protein